MGPFDLCQPEWVSVLTTSMASSRVKPRNTSHLNPIEPPHDKRYHLSEDLADKAHFL